MDDDLHTYLIDMAHRIAKDSKAIITASNRIIELETALSIMCTECDPGMWPERLLKRVQALVGEEDD